MLATNLVHDRLPFFGRLLNVLWTKTPIYGYQQVKMVPGL